jgi:DUF917 family protein
MHVDINALRNIAAGATVLGTGGGGDPHVGELVAAEAIEEYGPVELVGPDEIADDAFIVPTAQMGAPTVAFEKVPSGGEAVGSLERVEEAVGRTADATMPIECGGINSTIPFAVAARRGLPVVDADGMGRAFPELHHETFNVYGVSGTPAAVTDERGDTCLIETDSNERLERLARAVTVRMGGVGYLADYPMSGREVKETAIPKTVSLAYDLGTAIRSAGVDAVEAIRAVTVDSYYGAARSLFEGKIIDVQRRTEGGFVVGDVTVEGLADDDGRTMTVEFQNENLGARVDGEWVATVPDLITLLDQESGDPIPTESLRYGARVRVLGIPTPEIMRTDAALGVWGPTTFGLDTEYVSVDPAIE